MADHCHLPGLAGSHQVIQNRVDRVLVKNAPVAKAEEIIFQAFQLNHMLIRHVMDHNRGKIRLPSLGAHGRKFRARVFHFVIAVGKLVREAFQFEHRRL